MSLALLLSLRIDRASPRWHNRAVEESVGAPTIVAIISGIGVVAAMLRIAFRVYSMRTRNGLYFGPRLYQRFSEVLDQYEGEQVSPEVLQALQSRLDQLFFDVITGVGLVPDSWEVQVVLDDVLGPTARICSRTGEVLSVAEFEQRLRDGRLELAVRTDKPRAEGVYRSRSR